MDDGYKIRNNDVAWNLKKAATIYARKISCACTFQNSCPIGQNKNNMKFVPIINPRNGKFALIQNSIIYKIFNVDK
jgi:hypothetical protein